MPWDRRTYMREYMRRYRAKTLRYKPMHQACDLEIKRLETEGRRLKDEIRRLTVEVNGLGLENDTS